MALRASHGIIRLIPERKLKEMSYESVKQFDSPNFTPAASVASVFGLRRVISGITIHHWGDPSAGATFSGVVNYLCRKGGRTSAHAVIEAGRVAYIVDYKDAAWHSGSARGNATTIGLELNPRASEKDYETAAEHIADIWVTYGRVPLYRHSDWKATACPGKWNLLKLQIRAAQYYRAKTAKVPTEPKKNPDEVWHTVKKGETLWGISRKYATSVREIQSLNGMGTTTRIIAGKKIKIR